MRCSVAVLQLQKRSCPISKRVQYYIIYIIIYIINNIGIFPEGGKGILELQHCNTATHHVPKC